MSNLQFKLKLLIVILVAICTFAVVDISLRAKTFDYTITGVIKSQTESQLSESLKELQLIFANNDIAATITSSSNSKTNQTTIVIHVTSFDGSKLKTQLLETTFTSYMSYPYHTVSFTPAAVISVRAVLNK